MVTVVGVVIIKIGFGSLLLDIDEDQNVVFEFSYVVIGSSSDAVGFGEFLASDTARAILTDRGYLP